MSVGRAIYKCQSMILHGDKWKLQRLGALPYYYSCCRNQYLGSWSQLQPLLQNPWIYVSPIVVFGAYFAAFQQLKMVSDIISVSRLFQHKNAHKYGPIGSRQKCPPRNRDIALCKKVLRLAMEGSKVGHMSCQSRGLRPAKWVQSMQ